MKVNTNNVVRALLAVRSVVVASGIVLRQGTQDSAT